MVQVKYFIVLWSAIGKNIFYCESIQFQNQNLYGVMTNAHPKSSCLRINDIHSVMHCLQMCMANVGIYYMSSYNKHQQACLCCVDFSGSNITDPSWNTYEISKCIPTLSLHFQACYFKRGNNGLGISLFKRKRYLSHFFECDCEEIALLVEIPV